jgi:dienelactone hydrolase
MKRLLFPAVLFASSIISCNDSQTETPPATEQPAATPVITVKSSAVTYKDDTVTCQGIIAFNSSDSAKRPAVLVVPEWWGVVNFTRSRAEELAKLGYIAMTVDMFGNGKTAANPVEAGNMSMPFYQNPQMAKKRLEAALNELKKHPQADTSKIAAIGFCFGGSVVLNAAKLGADLDAVVSFHGGLEGVPPQKDLLKSKILVCHGASDSFVPQQQVDAFKKQMDAVGANYEFVVYPNATHAFTNPDATETGKKFKLPIAYNAAADTASWKDMKEFFEKNLR